MTRETKATRRARQLDRLRDTLGLSEQDAAVLFRAERVLHRWAELECGDGNGYASWSIERDEATGVPYLCTYPHMGATTRRKIADRERGALKRIAALCAARGLYFYHQTDPRGCALYVSREPLRANDYSSKGVALCRAD